MACGLWLHATCFCCNRVRSYAENNRVKNSRAKNSRAKINSEK
ncbi:hypothetical protein HMPREF3204_00078 [Gardnerella pickettii]|nr:hypothetical protein HMPREF3204_00078 [Gardnerella pickettii]